MNADSAQKQVEQVAKTLLVLGLANICSLALLLGLAWAIYAGTIVLPANLQFLLQPVFLCCASVFLAVGLVSGLIQYLGAVQRVSQARQAAKRLAHAERRTAKLYPISFFGSSIFLLGGKGSSALTERVVLAMKAGSASTALISLPAQTGTVKAALELTPVEVAVVMNDQKEPSLITLDERLYVVIMEYPAHVAALFSTLEKRR